MSTNPTEVYLYTDKFQWKYNVYIKSSLVEILSEYECGGASMFTFFLSFTVDRVEERRGIDAQGQGETSVDAELLVAKAAFLLKVLMKISTYISRVR